jgi:hypothetical protein
MQKKKPINTNIYNKDAAEDSEKKCCVRWENYVQAAK